MLLLAVTTSTPMSSVAIGTRDGVLAAARLNRPHAHAEFLTPAIAFCCAQAGVGVGDLTGVAVDVGPGLFTGLRVGIATAKGIALARNLPMAPFCSLDLLAFAGRHSHRDVVACIDARRGEVFWARYRTVPGGVERVGAPALASPDGLVAELLAAGTDTLLVGTGAATYPDHFANLRGVEIADVGLAHPSAAAALGLAAPMIEREGFATISEVVPAYLRRSDAELNAAARTDAASSGNPG